MEEEKKNQEDLFKDAEVVDVSEDTDGESQKKKGKTDYYIELILFLILGVLLGIAVKTESVKRVTIGYNDYKMKIMHQDYDINKLQADVLKKQSESTSEQGGVVSDEQGNANSSAQEQNAQAEGAPGIEQGN